MPITPSIAYFITAHGFGHASRAAAVMEAISERLAEVRFELFTTTAKAFFKNAIGESFGYHAVQSDIGMVQISPLEEDLTATCDQLDRLLPYDPEWIEHLATQLNRLNCRMVICDIAALGIEVARLAGIPSVLIENFTWDWIYEGYSTKQHRLRPHITYLTNLFRRVDHHIQTVPLCHRTDSAILIPPISRKARSSRCQIRKRLGVPEGEPMVLVTMGGVPDQFEFLSKLPMDLSCYLIVPGADVRSADHEKVILLPTHSCFFHPDLMAAADALVGKAGYSTICEAYQCGTPFGYIRRSHSPESAALESFIKEHISSIAIDQASYATGGWIDYLPEFLSLPRDPKRAENGADAAATYITTLLQAPKGCVMDER
jgi:hypothetical protein